MEQIFEPLAEFRRVARIAILKRDCAQSRQRFDVEAAPSTSAEIAGKISDGSRTFRIGRSVALAQGNKRIKRLARSVNIRRYEVVRPIWQLRAKQPCVRRSFDRAIDRRWKFSRSHNKLVWYIHAQVGVAAFNCQ